MNATETRLTAPQAKMLKSLAANGHLLVPGGSRKAALSAANWWRMTGTLVKAGFATRPLAGYGTVYITDAGRAVASGLE